MTDDQCVFIRGFRARRVLSGIRVIQIGSSRANERDNDLPSSLGDHSHIGSSSSSLDTIVPINHENPQLLQYPSSTALQSNGSIYGASFMTCPSYNSLIEVPNDIVEVRPSGHGHSLQLYLEGSGSTPMQRAQLSAPPFRTPPELPPSLCPASSQRPLLQPPGLSFSPGNSSSGNLLAKGAA